MDTLAESVGWLFGWLVRNSAHAALLGVVVGILDLTLLRHLSPRWRYGLWLIVIARLLVPTGPESALSLSNVVDFGPPTLAGVAHQIFGLPAPGVATDLNHPNPLADTPAWFVVAFALWLPGAVALTCVLGRDQRRISRALGATRPVEDSKANDLLRQCRGVMRVRWPVRLVETSLIGSPAITGWLRPRVLLPVGLLDRLSADETRFLILHELAHVKRADIALNWLLAAVQVLHWFNPVVWYALRRLLAVREEVCDELVLRRSFPGASREYGLTLLRLLEECAPRRIVPALAGVLDDVRSLRQRMRCIRSFGLREERPWASAGMTVALAIIGLTERPLPTQDSAAPDRPNRHRVREWRTAHIRTGVEAANAYSAWRATDSETMQRRRTASARAFDALSTAMQEAAAPPKSGTLAANRTAEPGNRASALAAVQGSGHAAVAAVQLLPTAPAAASSTRPVASVTRLYPLPPIGQRGDILRPPKERP